MNDKIIKKLFNDTIIIQILTALTAVLGGFVNGAITGICLGTKSMAAFGIVLPMTTIYSGIAGVFSSGISILCGKKIGAGDIKGANKNFSQCIVVAIATGILLFLITFFGAENIGLIFGANKELLPETTAYLKGFSFAGPAIILTVTLLPVMQIDGDRNRAFKAMLTTTIVNIFLNLINGFILHKGLFVMAIATAISYYAGTFVLFLHFIERKSIFNYSFTKLDFSIITKIFSYGLPNALQQIARSLLIICMNRIIFMISDSIAIAAYTAITSASLLCMVLGTGIGQGNAMITGVFSGEKDKESLKKLLCIALKTAFIYDLILLVFMYAFSTQLMRFFLKDINAFSIASLGFRIYILCIPIYAINVTLRSYYQAMHKTKITYLYVALDNFLCIVVLAFVLGKTFGLNGIWFSFLLGEILTLFIMMLFILLISHKKGTFIDRIMLIDDEFLEGIQSVYSWSCNDQYQVVDISQKIYNICKEQGANKRTAFCLSLALEELCMNIIKYGFTDYKEHSIDVKVIQEEKGWLLRIRDNCFLFDPISYLKNFDKSDTASQIGIKLVNEISNRFEYVNSLKLNNILIEINNKYGE